MSNTTTTRADHDPALPTVPGAAPDGASAEDLRGLFRHHPGGVAVVTAGSANNPVAMTVSSLISVSVTPPLIMFSASATSSSTPALRDSESVIIHLIDSDSHDIAILGATRRIDRFADRNMWATLPTGEPYYLRPTRRVRGRVVQTIDTGAATLFLIHALEVWNAPSSTAQPLVYHDRSWHTLGNGSLIA